MNKLQFIRDISMPEINRHLFMFHLCLICLSKIIFHKLILITPNNNDSFCYRFNSLQILIYIILIQLLYNINLKLFIQNI